MSWHSTGHEPNQRRQRPACKTSLK